MKFRYLTLCLVLVPLLTCSASNYVFQTLNVKDGLTDYFVRDVVRDSHGYIWVSTINGISRYDGYRFSNYLPLESGGRSNDMSSVRETGDSVLWMTCLVEFFTYDRKTANWQKDGQDRLKRLGVKGTAKLLYVDDRHNLWVSTDYGLFNYDYSQHKLLQIDNYSKSPISHIVAKNGMALFRQLKGNIKYSHIPVIFLTAKSGEENIIEGLKEGVADYITKPFSLEVLKLRIRKILEWSRQTHTKVAEGVEIKPSEITVSSLDEELISKVIANIEENISDTNYSVVHLSNAAGMTRGHLYKKLMAITGKSPLEFIRIIKLKRGKSLLDQGRTNISEVADKVGLSPKQFAYYFKLMYGDTPSEYLRKIRKV